ncbi:GldL-related protein [Hymenobacter nivis]|uniref:Gliding motility protein GldL-like N-terminal domain-containing protein n=1 Tax=Hymenobacter nivis TaxID=1850093 RepID=A0A2Z3GKV3_9BACT|nr:hypothetical protein [Hymenobacter nivis]AWM32682.1 hypothetical protein DDQ68_07715 [Hymenobacter nivis]
MKRQLDTVEKIAWPAALLGLAAKWALVPAGNYLLLLGLGTLGVVYFLQSYWPAAFAAGGEPLDSSAPAPFLDDYLRKVTSISAAVMVIGILFKLMNWSNGNTMLVVGVATMALVVVIAAFRRRLNRFAVAIAALGGLALYVPSETLIRQFHRDDPGLVEKLVYQLHHPRDRAAAADVQQYLQQKRSPR